jgi:hypothetical protein
MSAICPDLTWFNSRGDSRSYRRYGVSCPARLTIARRSYRARLINLGRGGARLQVSAIIRDVGRMELALPDLPANVGEVRWIGDGEIGVSFALPLEVRKFRDCLAERRYT